MIRNKLLIGSKMVKTHSISIPYLLNTFMSYIDAIDSHKPFSHHLQTKTTFNIYRQVTEYVPCSIYTMIMYIYIRLDTMYLLLNCLENDDVFWFLMTLFHNYVHSTA